MRRLVLPLALLGLLASTLGARVAAGTDLRAQSQRSILDSFHYFDAEFDWSDDGELLGSFVVESPESYNDLYDRALRENRALIVWVGVRPRPYYLPSGLHHEAAPNFAGVSQGIIISRPENGTLVWLATLPPDAPPEAVWDVLNQGLSV